MAYNNYLNPTPFKWPWTGEPATGPELNVAGRANFLFPSNMPQQEEVEPQPQFSQVQKGQGKGSRQFAPSFGASSGGGAHFRRM